MAKEFLSINEYLDIIGWSKPTMADRLDVALRLILRWANGQNETPLVVLEWLDALANAHLAYEKPLGWGELRLDQNPTECTGGYQGHG